MVFSQNGGKKIQGEEEKEEEIVRRGKTRPDLDKTKYWAGQGKAGAEGNTVQNALKRINMLKDKLQLLNKV